MGQALRYFEITVPGGEESRWGRGDDGLEERKGEGGRDPAGSLHQGVHALAVEPITKAELVL